MVVPVPMPLLQYNTNTTGRIGSISPGPLGSVMNEISMPVFIGSYPKYNWPYYSFWTNHLAFVIPKESTKRQWIESYMHR